MKFRNVIFRNGTKRILPNVWAGDFISHFLIKEVRKLHYELERYNTIFVSIIEDKEKVGCSYYEKDLNVNVYITYKEIDDYIDNKTDIERCEILISLMAKGFRMAYGFDSTVPCDMLLSLLDDFRKAGYVNRWQFKRVQLKELNMVAELNCRFDINDFRMTLALVDKKTKNKNKEALIYRTPPYWVCFEKDYRNAFVFDSMLFVTDFLHYPSFVFRLSDLKELTIKSLPTQEPSDTMDETKLLYSRQEERQMDFSNISWKQETVDKVKDYLKDKLVLVDKVTVECEEGHINKLFPIDYIYMFMHVCDGIVFDECGMVVYSIMQEYQECEKIQPMSLISMQNTYRRIDNAPEGCIIIGNDNKLNRLFIDEQDQHIGLLSLDSGEVLIQWPNLNAFFEDMLEGE